MDPVFWLKSRKNYRALSEIQGTVLIVDDDLSIRELIKSFLNSIGLNFLEAGSSKECMELLNVYQPDLIILDFELPDENGLHILEKIRGRRDLLLTPVVMLTGSGGDQTKLQALKAGVTDFIIKPFNVEELIARVHSLIQLKLFTDELEEAEHVIVTLAKTIDARDPYTASHSERVSYFAGLLGERIGLRDDELVAVQNGGLFHDIGKIAIRDNVLLKPGRLEQNELNHIQQHPVVGRALVQNMKSLAYALPIIFHHHEKMDGSGYPEGLTGERIPLVARVTTIADVYDALTSARVYRAALTRSEALEIMKREAAKGWWDPRLLDEFEGVLDKLSD